jgi:3-oxoacyl-[acyl-carrier protein] reductase
MATETQSPDFARLAPPAGSRLAVVGGCGGIGRALVGAALDIGLEVAVMDLPASHERHGVPEGVRFLPLDATDQDQVSAAFAELDAAWGGLDGLVNLCGFATPLTPIQETAPETFDETIAGNLRAVYLVARAAVPLMRKAGGGAIVNTASGLAFRAIPGFSPYTAAKGGVVAFTKALAVENAPEIRANVVAPTAVETAFLSGGTGRGGDDSNEQVLDFEAYAKTVPMGRIGVPEDVVGPVLFLLGDGARYMTGQVLHVNGGILTP